MNTQNNLAGILAVASIVLSVIGLIVSPVGASALTTPTIGDTGVYGSAPGSHHAFNATQMTSRLQTTLTKLGQQGVDVSQPQADISSGNVTAAMQWLTDYHKAHPGVMNTTAQHFGNTSAWHKGASFRSHHQLSGNQTSVRPSWVPEQTQSA